MSKQRPKEICAIRENISSFTELPLHETIASVNVHSNCIKDFLGLEASPNVKELDVSSNQISSFKDLLTFKYIRSLNLACNLITDVSGLKCLGNLVILNLSYNNISSLYGFAEINGAECKLQTIELHGNKISTVSEVTTNLPGISTLRHLILSRDEKHNNPVCHEKDYRTRVLSGLPQLSSLDSMDHNNVLVRPMADNVLELMGLSLSLVDEEFISDFPSSRSPTTTATKKSRLQMGTPNIDAVLCNAKSRYHAQDSDALVNSIISSIECGQDTTEDIGFHIPEKLQVNQEERLKYLEEQLSNLVAARQEKSLTNHSSNCRSINSISCENSDSTKAISQSQKDNSTVKKRVNPVKQNKSKKTNIAPGDSEEKNTYINLVKELENERERRWKSEQAARRLAQLVRDINCQKSEGKSLHDMAAQTADRLKQALLKEIEKTDKVGAEVLNYKEKLAEIAEREANFRKRIEEQENSIVLLKETSANKVSKHTKILATQSKKLHDNEMRLSAAMQEVEIQKSHNCKLQQRTAQLQDLLIKREHEHKLNSTENMFTEDSVEFRNALSRQNNLEEMRHQKEIKRLHQSIVNFRNQYSELEEEFRQALYIEADRYAKLETQFDHCSVEMKKLRKSNCKMEEREEKSRKIIAELTSVAKEQKIKIMELSKSKLEILQHYKDRIFNLEITTEDGRKKAVQLELIKQEKSKLISQLAAVQSVVDGLRDERKLWGHELAQQGVSLAQDRGRLESRIETLQQRNASMQKQNEKDLDALRIRSKIVDDQTETIQNMKQGLIEKDNEIARIQEDSLCMQRKFEQDVEDLTLNNAALNEKTDALTERKTDLKLEIANYEREMNILKQTHSKLVKRWAEKGQVISKVELQVRQMKEISDQKELKLIKERDATLEAKHLLMKRMERVDSAIEEQLETANTSHKAEIVRLSRDSNNEIEALKKKVNSLEEEMREVLRDAERQRRHMDDKLKKVSLVFRDMQDGLRE